jgi:hypothetical protein
MAAHDMINEKPMEQMILDHLQRVGSISGLEAHALYKCRSLPRRIGNLREAGNHIISHRRTDTTGQRYTRYALKGATFA